MWVNIVCCQKFDQLLVRKAELMHDDSWYFIKPTKELHTSQTNAHGQTHIHLFERLYATAMWSE